MLLKGSCHCETVKFRVDSSHPYPFNFCYCSICRKTAGAGGLAINLGADYSTMEVEGGEAVQVYQAKIRDPQKDELQLSPAQRNFCKLCGSALWVWDPRWPQLVHPFASAIDTELPSPPERTHIMLAYKPSWVSIPVDPRDKTFEEYPDESIADWHERLGLVTGDQKG
ncbi:MAG: GFA family protein [SAR324 cluster bacterium]|nr:GFA family protein [SAR324 cluster bacterium]